MYKGYKVDAIIQARMGSSRLPGKCMLDLNGKPVIQHIVERLKRSKYIDDVIVAMPAGESDLRLYDFCHDNDYNLMVGSEEDVLERVLESAKAFDTDIIVEVTADCPMIDPDLADAVVVNLADEHVHYSSNVIKRTFPRGLDVQAFWTVALNRVNTEVDNPIDRQHVSTWFYKNPKSKDKFLKKNISMVDINQNSFSDYRLTLDTKSDYDVLKKVFGLFDDNTFTYHDILNLISANTNLFKSNSHIEQKSYEKELEKWYTENTGAY